MTAHDRKNPYAGDHYAVLAIKPTEFAMANGWDAAAHAILKYVTRHALKNGAQDLGKGIYLTDERVACLRAYDAPFHIHNGHVVAMVGFEPVREEDPRIPMATYLDANKIPAPEAEILTLLDDWVRDRTGATQRYVQPLKGKIRALMAQHYGDAS